MLLPIFNCFVLFILREPDMILNKYYTWVQENLMCYLPAWLIKILGGCVLCTATWIAIIENLHLLKLVTFEFQSIELLVKYLIMVCYNAVATSILYNLLK